jgi:hypothetical protein
LYYRLRWFNNPRLTRILRQERPKRRIHVRKTTYLFVMGLAVALMAAVLASSELAVSAQNTNSSTTTMTNDSKPKPTRRARRGRRKAAAPAADAAAMDAAAMPAATPEKKVSGRCDPTQQEQTDLSGTYTGTLKHGDAPAMDATLTITGNTFNATMGSETRSGRITAVTTCGYTAVTMMTGDLTPPAYGPNPPPALPAMSLRAKKVGEHLTLMSVPGEKEQVSFVSAGAAKAAPRRHRARRKAKAGMPPPTPPAKQ